ncbi:hypothetical protein B0H12DRAFT_1235243 [Mycena haematopus]|nr:hypothetical protein B0H12DRAFT_1235243 [Mycena haematopus]
MIRRHIAHHLTATILARMLFTALGDDILLNILALGDVYTVLAVSELSKHLQALTRAKQLWLSLIQDSTLRNILELRPSTRDELEGLSTEELVGLVKRAVIGPPPEWPGPSSTRTPAYVFDTYLDLHKDSRLLPGARYMALSSKRPKALSQRILSIYEVWSGRRVWNFATTDLTHSAVDLVPGGAIARVLLTIPVNPVGGGGYLRVEEVDLITGVSHEVFALGFVTRFKSLSGIVGDFFLYPLPWEWDEDIKMVLVNWRASTYVVLSYGTETNSAVILIPGYVVATHPNSAPPHQQLTVTALDAFSPYWKPLTGISLLDQLSLGTIPITVQERLEYNGRPLGSTSRRASLSSTPSAVYQGAHTIVVYGGELPEPPPVLTLAAQMRTLLTGKGRPVKLARAALLSYSFRPPPSPGHGGGLRLVSAQRPAPGFDVARLIPPRAVMSYSGRFFTVSYYQ